MFTSSTKRENGQFHVAVVQRRQRNVHDACVELLFCQSNPVVFCRSRCRRRRCRPWRRRRRRLAVDISSVKSLLTSHGGGDP